MSRNRLLFIITSALFFLLPVLLLVLQSVSETWRFQAGQGFTFQLDSFEVLTSDPNLWSATGWSIAIGAGVLVTNLLIGILTGKALATMDFKGKSFVEAMMLSPILIPVLAIAMGLHLFMIRIGLADTLAGVILIHLVPTVPYSVKIFQNAYRQMGSDLLEQPLILGATPVHQLFTVELPLMKPAIRSVTFLTIVISLSQYAITAIIGGGTVITLPMVFFPFLDTANASIMAAFSIWFAMIPLLLYVIMEAILLLLPYTNIPWRNRT
ncbi:ABC transporter permease subunit [Halobacillus litoralis]|uniref:ABC transporter permease n=1 Tax=Halobacillus litoralis TaxID=45668 RepID=UPI001CD6487C|nr:ABC transporter permease subunit [Halobacillus litoralis]MCA0972610.1 ABC transporter permease subunit [Halobacillus litoralis]